MRHQSACTIVIDNLNELLIIIIITKDNLTNFQFNWIELVSMLLDNKIELMFSDKIKFCLKDVCIFATIMYLVYII